jgi:hypothetical protein
MAVSVDNRPTRLRSFFAAVLTVLILLPAGYLFFRVWQTENGSRTDTALEKQGVAYMTSLSSLISGLAEAQSSALQGVSTIPASLAAALGQMATADQQLGNALGTAQSWNNLRGKIAQLTDINGDQITVYQRHVEVSELALTLYEDVRQTSTLVRDPDNDLSNLQQAAGVDLPNTVVEVSRMGDLALMLSNVQGSGQKAAAQHAALEPQFGASIQFVNESVDALTKDLQQAVDDTNSATLSGNLVTTLDSFRRGVEAMTRGANAGGAPNASTIATAQSQLQTSLTALAGVIEREMDGLLQQRLDTIDLQWTLALCAAGLVVLLVIAILILGARGRRRRRSFDGARDRSVRKPGADHGYPGSSGPAPAYGEVNPTRRERSGALR